MAKPPAEEPKKIPNDKRTIFHKHLAIHILLDEQIKILQKRQAANLKAADQVGIPGKKIKPTHKLAKLAPSEIAKHYAEEFELLQFQGIDVGAQFNIFGGVDATNPKRGPDFYGAGLFAALDGKDGTPPRNLKGPEQQRWLEGWNDGVAARILGQEHLENAEAILNGANGSNTAGDDSDVDPDQTDLEDAVQAASVITIKLSDFGPEAVLEDMEMDDLDLTLGQIEKADRIEVVADDGRRHVLKDPDGRVGIAGEDFTESSEEELAAQKSRPSTQKASDPGADKED